MDTCAFHNCNALGFWPIEYGSVMAVLLAMLLRLNYNSTETNPREKKVRCVSGTKKLILNIKCENLEVEYILELESV